MSEPRAEYLPEAIREKLIHDPRVAEQDLRVEVQAHRVMLGGNVASPQLKQQITEVAPGVAARLRGRQRDHGRFGV